MKRYISVFALIAHNSIYRIFGLLILLTAADGVLAWYHLVHKGYDIINLFRSGGLGIVLAVIFALMVVVLIRRGDLFSGPQGYTMRRLGLSSRELFTLQIFYCIVCWMILWGVQLAILFAICKVYYALPLVTEHSTSPLYGQQIFLLFYTESLLHSLLPMEEAEAWAANLLMVLGLSVTTAYWLLRKQEGKPAAGHLILVYWIALLLFRRELGSFIINLILILFFTAVIIRYLWCGFFRKKEV